MKYLVFTKKSKFSFYCSVKWGKNNSFPSHFLLIFVGSVHLECIILDVNAICVWKMVQNIILMN